MPASAKRRKAAAEPDSLLARGAEAVSAFVGRNPAAVAGSTAFVVALLYVSANALWYQPHAHTGPFFATRAFESFVSPQRRVVKPEPETTIKIERPEETQPPPRLADPVVEKVQRILASLSFYDGEVDGRKGPGTRKAVEAYQRKMGLTPSGEIDQELLEQLGANDTTGAITPSPKPKDVADVATKDVADKELVARIQKGLRAFGNADIQVDGVLGARTKAGIKEFQSIFGLEATGEPNDRVYAKMKEAKLTD